MLKGETAMSIAKRLILMPLLLLVVAMLTPAPAEAAAPSILKIPIDNTVTRNFCGFTIVVRVEGHLTIHTFFDANGNPRLEIDNSALAVTWTNPANGMAITSRDASTDIVTFQQDGSATLVTVGLFGHFIVKGQGEVAAAVGKIVFTLDPEGNIIATTFEAGKHPAGGVDELNSVLCSILA
jgi:hypothetical protein